MNRVMLVAVLAIGLAAVVVVAAETPKSDTAPKADAPAKSDTAAKGEASAKSDTSAKSEDAPKPDAEGWFSLFDGKTLAGWKVGNNPAAFVVEDGYILARNGAAHLFYDGKVKDHNFKNFEFKADVMTWPKANGGIYFHTKYQERDWPNQGFEAQVNTSHSDPVRNGSLYNIVPVKDKLVNDNEWFHYYIKVEGKHIIIKINDKTTVDWTEPTPPKPPSAGRVIGSGTFAFQGHDSGSKTAYKNIMVRPLPD